MYVVVKYGSFSLSTRLRRNPAVLQFLVPRIGVATSEAPINHAAAGVSETRIIPGFTAALLRPRCTHTRSTHTRNTRTRGLSRPAAGLLGAGVCGPRVVRQHRSMQE